MTMKYAALTGISPSVIAELKSGKARTLELNSAHNIITLTETSPGECIFITSVNEEDLSPGDPGIMADLLVLNISMKRIRGAGADVGPDQGPVPGNDHRPRRRRAEMGRPNEGRDHPVGVLPGRLMRFLFSGCDVPQNDVPKGRSSRNGA